MKTFEVTVVNMNNKRRTLTQQAPDAELAVAKLKVYGMMWDEEVVAIKEVSK